MCWNLVMWTLLWSDRKLCLFRIVYISTFQGYETTCFETLTIPPPVELLLNTATKEIDIDETPADATTEEAGENTAETKAG